MGINKVQVYIPTAVVLGFRSLDCMHHVREKICYVERYVHAVGQTCYSTRLITPLIFAVLKRRLLLITRYTLPWSSNG